MDIVVVVTFFESILNPPPLNPSTAGQIKNLGAEEGIGEPGVQERV